MEDNKDERAERRDERLQRAEQIRHERDINTRKSALNAAANSLPTATEEKIIERAEHFLLWLKKE